LTNVSPTVVAPTLWNYAVCGQYPGVVGDGATVTLRCACNIPASRYLIVQFPTTVEPANFCELEVYIRRKFLYRLVVINRGALCSKTGRDRSRQLRL